MNQSFETENVTKTELLRLEETSADSIEVTWSDDNIEDRLSGFSDFGNQRLTELAGVTLEI